MTEVHSTSPLHGLRTAALIASLAAAACSGNAAAPSASLELSPATSPASSDTPVTAPPSDLGSDPDPGPVGGGKPVVPKPGQHDVHHIAAKALDARVDGRTIVVAATWTSGVEPCYVLDSIVVDKGDGTYTITLREGHGPGDTACIEIAERHQTVFEIPEVELGTWTIQDSGGMVAPVVVAVV
jgi:hypothetical protein